MVKMSQDDLKLTHNLEKLEIDGKAVDKRSASEERPNPFFRRRRSKSLSCINFGPRPTCDCLKKSQSIKHTTSFKRSGKKILREPVLKYVGCSHKSASKLSSVKVCKQKHYKHKDKPFGHCSRNDQNFKSLIDSCEQLTLRNCDADSYTAPSFINARPQAAPSATRNAIQRSDSTSSVSTSCSHQARMNMSPPCDVTIDELASYFETFVHIPKKMSSMAEMMYI